MAIAVQAKTAPRGCNGKAIGFHRSNDALIDEAGLGSFPASDPPGWTLGVGQTVLSVGRPS